MNVDLSAVTYSAVGQAATVAQPYTISRIVLIDATGKVSHTRIITNIATPASSPVVSWSSNDPLPTGFTAGTAHRDAGSAVYLAAYGDAQHVKHPGEYPGDGLFQSHRPRSTSRCIRSRRRTPTESPHLSISCTRRARNRSSRKGVSSSTATTAAGTESSTCSTTREARFNIIVDQPRQQADMLLGTTFGAVFMRGVVDVFPITPQ